MIDKDTKKKFLEELEKEGLIIAACRRSGLSRSTFYRWKKEDREFSKQVTKSQKIGRDNVNDLCDFSTIQLIREKNFSTIKWYKSFNDKRYKPKPRRVIIEHSKLGENQEMFDIVKREEWDKITDAHKHIYEISTGNYSAETKAKLEEFLRRTGQLKDDEDINL
jgi:hypothetical protein